MKYYAMKVDSLSNTFSMIDAGKSVVFELTTALSDVNFAPINIGDKVLGCIGDERVRAVYFFEVVNKINPSKISMKKCMEISEGIECNFQGVDLQSENSVVEIPEDVYQSIFNSIFTTTLLVEQNANIVGFDEKVDYSLPELAAILNQMYNNPDGSKKVTAIHMFGIKYGAAIRANGYTATGLADASNIGEGYHAEISKGLRIYDSIKNSEYGISFGDDEHLQDDISVSYEIQSKKLPKREKRQNRMHALNTIIYGAPGIGKTYSMPNYALAIIENSQVDLSEKSETERAELVEKYNAYIDKGQVVFTTFHQSYGYEDFIQGLRPDTTKNDGMVFNIIDGVFKKVADAAMDDPENNYVIIIDEINRANISKVFGELITLIEDDKRWGETNQTSVTLQSGEIFAVPNNLYILGTMNSADKSISLIDAALRRRFAFVEQRPEPSLIKDIKLREVFEKLNKRLVSDLDSSDLLIGHSYFIGKSIEDLPRIMNNAVIPLLYEYYYDVKKKVASAVQETIADTEVAIVNESFGRIRVEKNTR